MTRTSRTLLLLVIALATVAATAPGAAAWEPAPGAVFNNPKGNYDARWRIIKRIDQAVRSTPAGSRIMFSTFLMDSRASADALLAAHRRHVQVQIVMDGNDAYTHQARRLEKAFNEDNIDAETGEPPLDAQGRPLKWGPDQSFVVFCKGSCRGGRANVHAKFYAFTQTGTAHDVVMVSSSNLNAGGAAKGWNDLYVVKDRPAVLRAYSGIHAEMAQDTPNDGDTYKQYINGPLVSRFYPKTSGGDPVMGDLQKVRCRGATGGSGHDGRTAINISMFAWNAERGMTIARRLVALDKLGCDVSIIYGAPSKIVRDYLKASARRHGVRLWDSRFDRNEDGFFDLRVHHKYMLISGVYGGDTSSWRVHTGTQNWGQGTLRNGDENTLNVALRSAYVKYLTNWRTIATTASRRIPQPPSQEAGTPRSIALSSGRVLPSQ